MVTLHEGKLVIELTDPEPMERLNELRKSLSLITSVTVISEEMKYHSELPEAISELILLLAELYTGK